MYTKKAKSHELFLLKISTKCKWTVKLQNVIKALVYFNKVPMAQLHERSFGEFQQCWINPSSLHGEIFFISIGFEKPRKKFRSDIHWTLNFASIFSWIQLSGEIIVVSSPAKSKRKSSVLTGYQGYIIDWYYPEKSKFLISWAGLNSKIEIFLI